VRAATIKDAREHDFVPSVTTIIGQLSKPGLDQWKITQAIHAALTTPDLAAYAAGDMAEKEFVSKILKDSKEQAISAADEGSRYHLALLKRLTRQDYDEDLTDFVVAAYRWLDEKAPLDSWQCEQSFYGEVDGLGYGGTRDLLCLRHDMIADLKTQEFDDPKSVKVYPE